MIVSPRDVITKYRIITNGRNYAVQKMTDGMHYYFVENSYCMTIEEAEEKIKELKEITDMTDGPWRILKEWEE